MQLVQLQAQSYTQIQLIYNESSQRLAACLHLH